ncbi:MAG: SH3 domain-containing protein [Gallicola sp.]|nr:SH3 domain-containing protein [Gallicola sp.]
MKRLNKYLFMLLLIGLLSGCYKEESYTSKRESTETVEVKTKTNQETHNTGISNEQVNLRAKADVNSEIISQVPKGSEMEIIGVEEVGEVSWSRVIIENSVGYIQSQYISLEE